MKYRSEIDGLRALAVIPVILFHAGFSLFSGGFVGVDVFFVISGYLITTIILSEMEKGTFSLLNFYERRARRILPALFLVMLVSLPFAWFLLLPKDMKDFSQSLVAVSSFSSNIIFWLQSGYFGTASELKPLLHTWSLAVEEQYYVLFPLFLMFMWKYRKRWLLGVFFLIASISFIAAQWGAHHQPVAAFYLLPTRGWELAIGAVIAFYLLYRKQGFKTFLSHKSVNEVLGLFGLLLISYSVFAFDKTTPFPSFYTLVPTIGTGLIILFSSSKTMVGRLLSVKPMVAIGLISYSAYLWHQPLLAFARHATIFSKPNAFTLIVLVFLSFVLAYLSWKYIEKPFRSKDKFNRKSIFTYSLIASLAFIAIGLSGLFSNGLPNRLDTDVIELSSPNSGRLNNCAGGKKRVSGVTCLIGDPDTVPTYALLGDSHATRLTKGLDKTLRKNNKAMIVFAQPWCPPLIDFATDDIKKNPFCRDYMGEAFDYIKNSTSIKTVVLVAEWANYTKGLRGDRKTVSYYTDSHSKEKSLKENSLAFIRSLKRTRDILFKTNKGTILVTSVPEYNLDIPRTLSKLRLFGLANELRVEDKVDLAKYQERNKEVITSFEAASIKTWALVIDAYKVLCKEEYCSYMIDNKAFYMDANHLSYEGSKLFVREIEKHINQ